MKKIIAILLVVLSVLALMGCGKVVDPINPTPDDPIVTPTKGTHTVTFYDMYKKAIQTLQLKKGEMPAYTDFNGVVQSIIEGNVVYSFIGWDKEITPVTGDASYYAQYKKSYLSQAQAAKENGFIIKNTGNVNGGFYIKKNNSPSTNISFECSLDDGYTWSPLTASSSDFVSIPAGSHALVRNASTTTIGLGENVTKYYSISFGAANTTYEVDGDITYMINKNGVASGGSIPDFCFNGFLNDSNNGTKLTSIGNNFILPSALSSYCFYNMFAHSGLTELPNNLLPSQNLASHCYEGMFRNCSSLEDVSNLSLPALTLADYCYASMFDTCTNLTTGASLPATSLAERCYFCIYSTCGSLNTFRIGYDFTSSNPAPECAFFRWLEYTASSGNIKDLSGATILKSTITSHTYYNTAPSTENVTVPGGWNVPA